MPKLTLIAGPNGAGKTTLVRFLDQQGFDFGEIINPDEISAALGGHCEANQLQARELADRRADECLAAGRDFALETVLSHPSRLDLMRRARSVGFGVTLIYICVDTDGISAQRVAQRHRMGGHAVDPAKVRARYRRSLQNLPLALAAADEALVFDNSAAGDRSDRPRLILRKAIGGETLLNPRAAVPNWLRRALGSSLPLPKPVR